MSLFREKKNTRITRKNSKLCVQKLEDRKLMAADFGFGQNWLPEIEVNGSVVEIQGSWLSDDAEVEVSDRGTDDPSDDIVLVRVSNALDSDVQTFQKYDAEGNDYISKIVFRGQNGNDRFDNNSDISSWAYGGNGNDRLEGGTDVDHLFGQAGDDVLIGKAGNDKLFGSSGDDDLWGQNGDDYLRGGSGADYLNGGQHNDELRGDTGDDSLIGSGGRDLLRGGHGDDHLNGSSGHDTLMGESGTDSLFGMLGNDLLHGGDGNDYLYGGDNNDLLIGGDGSDRIYGQNGHDTLYAGDLDINAYVAGASFQMPMINKLDDDDDDFLHGGAGEDTFAIGDYDFLEIGTDSLVDYEAGERVKYMDEWSIFADMDGDGIPSYNAFGHRTVIRD